MFCDETAKDIIAMLKAEMDKNGAQLWLKTDIGEVSHDGTRFKVSLIHEGQQHQVIARNLIVATGGKSIPEMGSTGLAYQIATQFGLSAELPPTSHP